MTAYRQTYGWGKEKEKMKKTVQKKMRKVSYKPFTFIAIMEPERQGRTELETRKRVTAERIKAFETALHLREKSLATIQKYVHQVREFAVWLDGEPASQQKAIEYKAYLKTVLRRKNRTVNTVVAALNSFFKQQGWDDIRLTALRIQQEMFLDEERLLSLEEYRRLLNTAKWQGDIQFNLILQTLCSTGIRVSELKHITVDAVQRCQKEIECKGKIRKIVLPKTLAKSLRQYCRQNQITSGEVFRNEKGKSISRFEVWRKMKALCDKAGVKKEKAHPHNLRHLFARTFYAETKDIVKLADLLGHSNIQTTRIYTLGTLQEEYQRLDRLGLAFAG